MSRESTYCKFERGVTYEDKDNTIYYVGPDHADGDLRGSAGDEKLMNALVDVGPEFKFRNSDGRRQVGEIMVLPGPVERAEVNRGVWLFADRLLWMLTEWFRGKSSRSGEKRIGLKHRPVLRGLGKQPNRVACETGAVIPETALILGIIFLLLFGIMEFGILFFNRAVIINASREGARLGAMFDVDPANNFAYSPPTDAEITQKVLDYSAGHLISFGPGTTPQVQVSPSWSGRQASGPGTPLRVTLNYQFQFLVLPGLTPGLPGATKLSAETRMRME